MTEPEVGPGQVKVRVEQIAVNPLDWKIRNGYLAEILPLPVVIGSDLPDGDPVAGFADSGAFAAVAVTRRERLTKLPDGLAPRLAAALVTSAETAQRVIGLLDPAPASTPVVNGAAGAVGSAVTQLLAAAGHRVIGTASTANHDYLRHLGAAPAGYADTMPAALRAAAPDGVDGAIDTAGQDFVARVEGLIPADRIVTIVDFAAGARGAIVAGGDPTQLTAETIGAVLEQAVKGTFTVEIDAAYPFEELGQALAPQRSGTPSRQAPRHRARLVTAPTPARARQRTRPREGQSDRAHLPKGLPGDGPTDGDVPESRVHAPTRRHIQQIIA